VKGKLPLLREARVLCVGDGKQTSEVTLDVFEDAPQLRSFYLKALWTDLAVLRLPWVQLKRFGLQTHRIEDVSLAMSAPLSTTIHITFVSRNTSGMTTTVAPVYKCGWRRLEVYDCGVLDYFTLPHLEDLSILSTISHKPIKPFLQRSICSLQSLTLKRALYTHVDTLRDTFALLPTLVQLRIEETPIAMIPISSLTVHPERPTLLPNLQRLSLYRIILAQDTYGLFHYFSAFLVSRCNVPDTAEIQRLKEFRFVGRPATESTNPQISA
jgi:hypothetical protein